MICEVILLQENHLNGNKCDETLTIGFPDLLGSSANWLTMVSLEGLKSSQNRTSEACPRLYREYKSMQHVYIRPFSLPPFHTHTKPLHQGEYLCDKRHLNDIWRVPMKRPSPHSEVGQTEEKQFLRTPSPLGQAVVAQSSWLHRKWGLQGRRKETDLVQKERQQWFLPWGTVVVKWIPPSRIAKWNARHKNNLNNNSNKKSMVGACQFRLTFKIMVFPECREAVLLLGWTITACMSWYL